MDDKTNDLGASMEPNLTEHREGSAGPVIGTIIILAVIVLGGLYFWGQRAGNQVMEEAEVGDVVSGIMTQSESDATLDIEADLKATNIDDIDSQLNGI